MIGLPSGEFSLKENFERYGKQKQNDLVRGVKFNSRIGFFCEMVSYLASEYSRWMDDGYHRRNSLPAGSAVIHYSS